MKTKLLLIAFLAIYSLNAQTTHNIDWERNVTVDLTIEVGDIVVWTWTDPFPHTVENMPGNSVENFDSGTLTGIGLTFSHTFTIEGDNDYFCGIHGAGSMSGTITVDATASINEEVFKTFTILPNPAKSIITVKIPNNTNTLEIEVLNITGKRVLYKSLNSTVNTTLNLTALQSGMYLVRVTSGRTSQTKRLVKL